MLNSQDLKAKALAGVLELFDQIVLWISSL